MMPDDAVWQLPNQETARRRDSRGSHVATGPSNFMFAGAGAQRCFPPVVGARRILTGMTAARRNLCILYGVIALVALIATWAHNIAYFSAARCAACRPLSNCPLPQHDSSL